MVGARSATALMLRLGFVNRHCDGKPFVARNCEGRGRREHMREGRAESRRYEDGIASIAECAGKMRMRCD